MLDKEPEQTGSARTALEPEDQRSRGVPSWVLGWDVPEEQVGVVLFVDGEVSGVAGGDGVQSLVLDPGRSLDDVWTLVGLYHGGQEQGFTHLETKVKIFFIY